MEYHKGFIAVAQMVVVVVFVPGNLRETHPVHRWNVVVPIWPSKSESFVPSMGIYLIDTHSLTFFLNGVDYFSGRDPYPKTFPTISLLRI